MKLLLRFSFLLLLVLPVSAQEKRGEKESIDLSLAKARQSVQGANYGEAINHFAHCLDLAERDERKYPLTPVLDALLEWHALAEKYPPAGKAFNARRDQDTAKVLSMTGDKKNFEEAIPHRPPVLRIAIMNHHLDQPAKTVELFKTIESKYPNFAQFVDELCQDALIAEGEYDLVLKYLGDPDSSFEAAKKKYLNWKDREKNGKAGILAAGTYERGFVYDMNRFLKVLYASGATEQADDLRKKAFEVVGSRFYFVPDQE